MSPQHHEKVTFTFPLPASYVREVWNCSKASIKNIKKVVLIFYWTKNVENLSVDEKVNLLNETFLHIFRNYIPNKKIKFNYCQPPWMNDNIKRCLKKESKWPNFIEKWSKEIRARKIRSKSCLLYWANIKSQKWLHTKND